MSDLDEAIAALKGHREWAEAALRFAIGTRDPEIIASTQQTIDLGNQILGETVMDAAADTGARDTERLRCGRRAWRVRRGGR